MGCCVSSSCTSRVLRHRWHTHRHRPREPQNIVVARMTHRDEQNGLWGCGWPPPGGWAGIPRIALRGDLARIARQSRLTVTWEDGVARTPTPALTPAQTALQTPASVPSPSAAPAALLAPTSSSARLRCRLQSRSHLRLWLRLSDSSSSYSNSDSGSDTGSGDSPTECSTFDSDTHSCAIRRRPSARRSAAR